LPVFPETENSEDFSDEGSEAAVAGVIFHMKIQLMQIKQDTTNELVS
jgi:hypothetical protein